MNVFSNTPLVIFVCPAVLFGTTILTAHASQKQEVGSDFAAIDEYVDAQRDRLGIPGLTLGIVQGDQVAHLQGFGSAGSSGRAVTPQTSFQIGSLTKSFIALAMP